jgi:hypothetical protein
VAGFATLWGVMLEAAVALAFLWPPRRRLARMRDGVLLLFAASVYAVATVEGFAWLLLSMGAAQCRRDRRHTRLAYIGVFALILFYREVDWAT